MNRNKNKLHELHVVFLVFTSMGVASSMANLELNGNSIFHAIGFSICLIGTAINLYQLLK